MKKTLKLIALRFRRTWHVMITISAFATGLGALWWHFDLLSISDQERSAYDDGVKKFTGKDWFPWGQVKQSRDVVIVAIDDRSIREVAQFGPWKRQYSVWPWDRMIWSDLVDYFAEVGVRAVVFDSTMEEMHERIDGDCALGDSLRKTRLPYYTGFNFVPGPPVPAVTPRNWPAGPADLPFLATQCPHAEAEPDGGTAPPGDFPGSSADDSQFPDEAPADAGASPRSTWETEDAGGLLPARLERTASLAAFPVEMRGGLELRHVPTEVGRFSLPDGGSMDDERSKYPVPSMDPILDSVTGFGVVLSESDEDGKMRRTAFAYTDGVNSYVTLPVAVAADLFHAEKVVIEPRRLTIGERQYAIDSDGAAWIDYEGTLQQRFRTIPVVDVLNSRATHELDASLKGKVVVIGGFALGTGDSKSSPLEQAVPGVVKQAATLDNLLTDGFITDAPLWSSLVFTFLMCLLSTALVLIVRNSFVDIGWPVALYVGFFLMTGSFLVLTKLHVLTAMPSLAGTLASVLATTWERIFADKQRDQMKEKFSAFMESDLVEMMVEQDQLPRLDGDIIRITAFFSDIKGFSTFSELFREDQKGLMRLLNRYLSHVTPVLTAQGACIDKYIGDAVVALFGAPVSHADHALRACRGALAVQQSLHELRADFKAEGLPDVYTRIGLNTDELLVGNIGSAQLLDYTAIGDGMNLAARLEGANKIYGTLILMGENTYGDVKQQVVAREVDQVRVAGKHIPVRIYELLGLAGQVPAPKLRVVELYAGALSRYRARDFAGALTVLDEIRVLDAGDGPSETLRNRCLKFLKDPPPPEWDGVADLEK